MLFPLSALRDGNLKEITKPYLGEYECQSATLGDTDLATYYKSIVLDLKKDGTFFLTITDKMGKKHAQSGKYAYDEQTGMLTFCDSANGGFKRECALDKGECCLTVPVGGKMVRIKFARK